MEFNGTFFAAIISFIVFVFAMNKILYVPMRKIVEERKAFIDGNYSDASENNEKADKLSNERDAKLVEAKDDAKKQYNELLDEFKSERNGIIQNAHDEAGKSLDEEYAKLENVSNEAKEKLKASMNDLANDIVEKVIGYRSEFQGFDDEKVNSILYR